MGVHPQSSVLPVPIHETDVPIHCTVLPVPIYRFVPLHCSPSLFPFIACFHSFLPFIIPIRCSVLPVPIHETTDLGVVFRLAIPIPHSKTAVGRWPPEAATVVTVTKAEAEGRDRGQTAAPVADASRDSRVTTLCPLK